MIVFKDKFKPAWLDLFLRIKQMRNNTCKIIRFCAFSNQFLSKFNCLDKITLATCICTINTSNR